MRPFRFVLAERRNPRVKRDEPGNAYEVYDRATGAHLGRVVRWWTVAIDKTVVAEWSIIPFDSDAYEHHELRRDAAAEWLRKRWLDKEGAGDVGT